MQQISEYISEEIWISFLKRHMDAIDRKKTFKDHPENVVTFTGFIQSAFNFYVQEVLLEKEVNDAVKNLNHMTVDMKVFPADGKEVLKKLDIRLLLNLD
jgi:hypothetical protein